MIEHRSRPPGQVGALVLASCLALITVVVLGRSTDANSLGRDRDPVVVSGGSLPASLATDPARVVAFRWNGGWVQIPVQIDERAIRDFGTIIDTTATGLTFLTYTDSSTFTGADEDLLLDADDELVLRARDAGDARASAPEDPHSRRPKCYPGTRPGASTFLPPRKKEQEMSADYVPVTQGSSDSHFFETDGLRVIEAWFPPGLRIPPHRHDRPIFAVMIEGSFDVDLAHRSHSCTTSAVFTEPLGERHANRVDRGGARVVVLQPDPERAELLEPCAALFRYHQHFLNGRIGDLARRLAQELDGSDSLSRIAAEGLALEMLAVAARVAESESSRPRPPRWLARAQDLLHEHFMDDLRVVDVAREVGVHPVYLARVFRAHLRVPIAEYVRGLRLEWAARRLAHGEEALCEIALAAGFADQSHFTRAFKRYVGATPSRYRRRARG